MIRKQTSKFCSSFCRIQTPPSTREREAHAEDQIDNDEAKRSVSRRQFMGSGSSKATLKSAEAERLFKAKQCWPKSGLRERSLLEPRGPRPPMTPMEEAELDPANMDNTPDPNARFQSHNDVLCLYKAPSKKEAEEGSTGTYTPLANFDIVQYLSLFTFIDLSLIHI